MRKEHISGEDSPGLKDFQNRTRKPFAGVSAEKAAAKGKMGTAVPKARTGMGARRVKTVMVVVKEEGPMDRRKMKMNRKSLKMVIPVSKRAEKGGEAEA
jgi:hypothetical protein